MSGGERLSKVMVCSCTRAKRRILFITTLEIFFASVDQHFFPAHVDSRK